VRGRRPVPPQLRLLRGNPGKRPLPRRDIEPTAGASCPENLSREAKREWKRIAPELLRLGLLTELDRAALACFCESWAEFRWATGIILREGKLQRCTNGMRVAHPALVIRRQAAKQILQFGCEFGLTPASQSRVEFIGGADDDESERFFGPKPPPGPKRGA